MPPKGSEDTLNEAPPPKVRKPGPQERARIKKEEARLRKTAKMASQSQQKSPESDELMSESIQQSEKSQNKKAPTGMEISKASSQKLDPCQYLILPDRSRAR
jgi:hypothetical protein